MNVVIVKRGGVPRWFVHLNANDEIVSVDRIEPDDWCVGRPFDVALDGGEEA